MRRTKRQIEGDLFGAPLAVLADSRNPMRVRELHAIAPAMTPEARASLPSKAWLSEGISYLHHNRRAGLSREIVRHLTASGGSCESLPFLSSLSAVCSYPVSGLGAIIVDYAFARSPTVQTRTYYDG